MALGVISVAIICALGYIATPLAVLQGNLIAEILAFGCVGIGVISILMGAIICQRDRND